MMSDLVESRLEKAKKMGADHTILIPEKNLEKEIEKFTRRRGDSCCNRYGMYSGIF